MSFFSRRLRCKAPESPVPGEIGVLFHVERCVNCNREIILGFDGVWRHRAEFIPSKKGLERRRAFTPTGDKVHARRDDYPNAGLCGTGPLVREAQPYDYVTCRRCKRLL